jgi:hypothetical protein
MMDGIGKGAANPSPCCPSTAKCPLRGAQQFCLKYDYSLILADARGALAGNDRHKVLLPAQLLRHPREKCTKYLSKNF